MENFVENGEKTRDRKKGRAEEEGEGETEDLIAIVNSSSPFGTNGGRVILIDGEIQTVSKLPV